MATCLPAPRSRALSILPRRCRRLSFLDSGCSIYDHEPEAGDRDRLVTEEQKRRTYRAVAAQLAELLSDIRDAVTAMSTCAALLHEALPQSSWTGFYRVVAPGQLRVGPYQGPVGCLEIPFGRGVCGAAASQSRTLIVDDVQSFPDHIACDAAARSEIVVPIFDESENLVAVLDIDSRQLAAFNDVDRDELERLAGTLRRQFGSASPSMAAEMVGVAESGAPPG